MLRLSFDKASRIAAVKFVIEEGFFVKKVKVQQEVNINSLFLWAKEVEKCGESAFPGKGSALFDAHYEMKKGHSICTSLKMIVREKLLVGLCHLE